MPRPPVALVNRVAIRRLALLQPSPCCVAIEVELTVVFSDSVEGANSDGTIARPSGEAEVARPPAVPAIHAAFGRRWNLQPIPPYGRRNDVKEVVGDGLPWSGVTADYCHHPCRLKTRPRGRKDATCQYDDSASSRKAAGSADWAAKA
ncbi:hypothetical protein OsI_07334 [Oryza sativa Indica Group]|uniref:Uncharacterized protein n=1 Tax=Oryza sativa subsp. indica TaxID=39946 RepID=B8AIC1_ORYSI|nr:hypothetical protein OsI_07334 [Oryza sativa Indica Group]